MTLSITEFKKIVLLINKGLLLTIVAFLVYNSYMRESKKHRMSLVNCPNRRTMYDESLPFGKRMYIECPKYPEGFEVHSDTINDGYYTLRVARQMGCLACPFSTQPQQRVEQISVSQDGITNTEVYYEPIAQEVNNEFEKIPQEEQIQ